ncbi:MAG: hypothetical protein FJ290_18540 [Planctomycetes bacterium]|nr:hypothetical protein [Planctomycetota bacterium]
MATVIAKNTQDNGGLGQRDRTELRRFETCSETELATFRPQTLARYRSLMLRYSGGFRVEHSRQPQTAA